jgi:hypothetical protein
MAWGLQYMRDVTAAGFRRAVGVLCAALLLIFGLSLPATAQSAANEAAERATSRFLSDFDSSELSAVYAGMGPTFRQTYTERQFTQQAGMMRLQLGGSASGRVLVGSQPLSQMPNGVRGDFVYVRYKARYANGFVYQDAMLEKSGTEWRIGGFNFLPAPPN